MLHLCIRFNSNFFRIKKQKLTWIKNNLEKTVYNAIQILVRCLSVVIDFIGPLLEDDGYDGIMTMTDRIGADLQMEPVKMSMSAKDEVQVFFDEWYCNNGLPLEIV